MTLPETSPAPELPCRCRMSPARWVALFVVVVILTAALVVWLRAPADPLYKGKRLSTYLSDTVTPSRFPPSGVSAAAMMQSLDDYNRRQREASEALHAIGGRAMPLLTSWFESDEGLQGKLRRLALQPGSRWGWLLRWHWIVTDYYGLAYRALLMGVPNHAVSLLPNLRKRVLDGKMPRAEEALVLLTHILNAVPIAPIDDLFQQNRVLVDFYTADLTNRLGATAMEAVASILRHGPPEETERLIRHLWLYRTNRLTNARFAIVKLDQDGFMQNMLYLEGGNPRERPSAALYFKDKPCQPERIVPLLMTNLTTTASANLLQNVCDALAAYGTNATPALPQLTNLLSHPKAAVREAAERAIGRIWRT